MVTKRPLTPAIHIKAGGRCQCSPLLQAEISAHPGGRATRLVDKVNYVSDNPGGAGWPSLLDGRHYHLALTNRGRKAFAPLDRQSREQASAMLDRLSPPDRERLIAAMHTIEELLGAGGHGWLR